MIGVIVGAGAASWESALLRTMADAPDLHLLRRCVDLADVLACVDALQPRVAVVSTDLAGLDLEVVERVRRTGCVVVAVGRPGHAVILGADVTAAPSEVLSILRDIARSAPGDLSTADLIRSGSREVDGPRRGRVDVVWGPPGAPGRSTLAAFFAAEHAHRGRRTVLVDADLQGGTQAQAWGLLDDASGLLGACRAANQGRDAEIGRHAVALADGPLVLSGLMRADMWNHIRVPAFERVVEVLRHHADQVVIDLGPFGPWDRRGQGQLTEAALVKADDLWVVGRCDPVGIARLVRSLDELTDMASPRPLVLLNQWRRALGWSRQESIAAVEQLCAHTVHAVIADDDDTLDRCRRQGRLPHHAAPRGRLTAAVRDLIAERADALDSTSR